MPAGPQPRARRVRVRYRAEDGAVVETTLDRVAADEVVGGLPVREFHWYQRVAQRRRSRVADGRQALRSLE